MTSFNVNDEVTVTRVRDNVVREGRIDRITQVQGRTMVTLHQPTRTDRPYGNYYLADCVIVLRAS